MEKIVYLIRYVYKRIIHRFKSIGFPVGFESNTSIFNAKFISIGDNVFIGKNVIIQAPNEYKDKKSKPQLIIANKVTIGMNSWINAISRIEIQENVLIAPNVYIADHMHKYTNVNKPIRYQGVDKIAPILIKKDSWISTNVIINPGVTIGKGSVIGANSMVSNDIPDYSVAVGSPARVIKKYNFKTKKWEKS